MAYTTPRVWSVGENLSAAHLNTFISGNDAALFTLASVPALVTIATKSIATGGGTNQVITWAANQIDTLGAYNASNAYLLCTTAGFYEMDFLTTWSGGTGTGGIWGQIDRYNSSGSFVETWGFNDETNMNLAFSCHGAGLISANDRIVCTINGVATGAGGTAVCRGVLARRY